MGLSVIRKCSPASNYNQPLHVLGVKLSSDSVWITSSCHINIADIFLLFSFTYAITGKNILYGFKQSARVLGCVVSTAFFSSSTDPTGSDTPRWLQKNKETHSTSIMYLPCIKRYYMATSPMHKEQHC